MCFGAQMFMSIFPTVISIGIFGDKSKYEPPKKFDILKNFLNHKNLEMWSVDFYHRKQSSLRKGIDIKSYWIHL